VVAPLIRHLAYFPLPRNRHTIEPNW
jgi:hypothetical protein